MAERPKIKFRKRIIICFENNEIPFELIGQDDRQYQRFPVKMRFTPYCTGVTVEKSGDSKKDVKRKTLDFFRNKCQPKLCKRECAKV